MACMGMNIFEMFCSVGLLVVGMNLPVVRPELKSIVILILLLAVSPTDRVYR